MRRGIVLQLAGLLLLAGVVGLYLGLRAVPPTETEIINAVAAEYVAQTGGALTDCHAEPSTLDGVRMVVFCQPQTGSPRLYPVDAWGVMVETLDPTQSQEPQT